MKTIELLEQLAVTTHHNKKANALLTNSRMLNIFLKKRVGFLQKVIKKGLLDLPSCNHTFAADLDADVVCMT